MDFSEWEPIYLEILEDFGFPREEDERAALILSNLLPKKQELNILQDRIFQKDVLVCGNSHILAQELEIFDLTKYVIIAADGATTVVMNAGFIPDVIVTDLDGDVEKEIEASERGAIVVVHAHGNNIDKLIKYVSKIKNIIGSTQAEPLENVFNFGGFSDGDRAVYISYEFEASNVTLAGFMFDDCSVSSTKKKKLKWARKLIEKLNK